MGHLPESVASASGSSGGCACPPATATGALQQSADPVVMRTPILNSWLEICHKVLKGENKFQVSEGGVMVKATMPAGTQVPNGKGNNSRTAGTLPTT